MRFSEDIRVAIGIFFLSQGSMVVFLTSKFSQASFRKENIYDYFYGILLFFEIET